MEFLTRWNFQNAIRVAVHKS